MSKHPELPCSSSPLGSVLEQLYWFAVNLTVQERFVYALRVLHVRIIRSNCVPGNASHLLLDSQSRVATESSANGARLPRH